MNIAILASSDEFNTNVIFSNMYRDDCLYFFRQIKLAVENKGWHVNAINEVAPELIDILIVYRVDLNIGRVLKIIKANSAVKIIHIMHEPSVVVPMHTLTIAEAFPFDLQYILNDDVAENSSIIRKICYAITPFSQESIPSVRFEEKKFMATIAGEKHSNAKNELYSERIRAIKFFSKKPTGFDLYGVGWDRCKDEDVRKVYLGVVDTKKDVLKNYKYALCFENTQGSRGYITEKIFDCFAAATVPIYYGAPNIEDYIPKDCYIDFRDFEGYEDLYVYLCEMPDSIYQEFLDAVKKFIGTNDYRKINAHGYVDTLMKGIDEISDKTIMRSSLGVRFGLLFNVLKNGMFYVKNLRKTKRYLIELLSPF